MVDGSSTARPFRDSQELDTAAGALHPFVVVPLELTESFLSSGFVIVNGAGQRDGWFGVRQLFERRRSNLGRCQPVCCAFRDVGSSLDQ